MPELLMNDSKKQNPALWFIITSLLALALGMFFGLVAGLQYILPDFLKTSLGFYKSRPLHVSLVISWIFLAATGGIYYYLPIIFKRNIFSPLLIKFHLAFFLITGISIIICYFLGIFGGREYFEFPPVFAIPIGFLWILFALNFFKTIHGPFKNFPVYIWMWITGILFFLFTLMESCLWQLPFFRDNIIRDISVQWKALGSMVGSWNMLVYGTSFFIMEKIKGDSTTSSSKISFFFYFLSLTNLMFNWGHHTYILPASPVIKTISYFISMTELLILFHIIFQWKNTLSEAQKRNSILPYRFLFAADIWIFLNLLLAIIISIPSINFYTHGTHITVAHAMGATIGINTTLLFASVYFIFYKERILREDDSKGIIEAGFWITNISLLFFWISLIGAGITRAIEDNHPYSINNFNALMVKLSPFFNTMNLAGSGIFIGIFLLIFPLLKSYFRK